MIERWFAQLAVGSAPSATRGILAFVSMLIGVLAVYSPLTLLSGDSSLYGMDFWALHLRRIQFVHENLSATSWTLPGWYPHELFGTPFWSNLQNFPWIPTRLVLLLFDPPFAYTVGVNLAAMLAASFTYLFGRAIGWGRPAAALAGWTFACAGFFAARVTVGHLPLLEAYPALPLLLWLVERSLRRGNRAGPLAALALGTACVVVAGHPQIPAYAVASALLYLFAIGRRQVSSRPAAAIALGAASTLAVWWPMLALLRRSTRTLALEIPRNDLALPYERLAALILPWKDGWPTAVLRTPPEAFSGFPSSASFWETVAYVGIFPWLAVVALSLLWLRGPRPPAPRAVFFAVFGLASLFAALPWVDAVGALVPGTYLRSPARLLYLTSFVLALAAGASLDAFLRSGWPPSSKLRGLLATIVAFLHVFDLATHDRPFIYTRTRELKHMARAEQLIAEYLEDRRVAIDYNSLLDFNRRFDDIGFFDSVILARPYRAMFRLGGLPPDRNTQNFNGSALAPAVLSNLGVRFVITRRSRRDLPRILTAGYHLYAVPHPSPRVRFLPPDAVTYSSESAMYEQLGLDGFDMARGMMLPIETERPSSAAASPPPEAEPEGAAEVEYLRPSPDRISLRVDAPGAGFVRILDSWDPGWTATLDGRPVPLLRADTFAIAVEVDRGEHRIELAFRTPGARAGAGASLASLLLLAALLWTARRRRSEAPRP
jgi:hypothetical protein